MQAARAATAAAERDVEASYAAMKEGDAAGGALGRLQSAQATLAQRRVDEARRACESRLKQCQGGEAAAEALETLRSAGVDPDAACYRRGLAACGGEIAVARPALSTPEWLAEQAQWAQLLHGDMQSSSWTPGPAELSLALRPCVLSGRWDVASELLLTGEVSFEEAAFLLRFSLLRQVDGGAASPEQARVESRLAALFATELLEGHEWDGARLLLRVGALPPAAAAVLAGAALDDLCAAQERRGPQEAVVRSDLAIELSLAAATPALALAHEGMLEGGVGESAATFWRAMGVDFGERAPPRHLADALRTEIVAALEAAGMAARDVGEPQIKLKSRSCTVGIKRGAVEGWVLERCMRLWQGEVLETELQRRQADLEEEKGAAKATATMERQQAKWRAKNEKVADSYYEAKRNERSAMAVVVDNAVLEVARKASKRAHGKVASEAGPAPATPAAFLSEPAPEEVVIAPAALQAGLRNSAALVGEVSGIGPKRAEKLQAAGIATARQLAGLSDGEAERVAVGAGIPLSTLATCIQNARRLTMDGGGEDG